MTREQEQTICDAVMRGIAREKGSSTRRDFRVVELTLAAVRSLLWQPASKCLHCKELITSCNGEVCDLCAHRLNLCAGCSACLEQEQQAEDDVKRALELGGHGDQGEE